MVIPVESCRSPGGQVTARRASIAGCHEIPLLFHWCRVCGWGHRGARRVKSAFALFANTTQCASVLGWMLHTRTHTHRQRQLPEINTSRRIARATNGQYCFVVRVMLGLIVTSMSRPLWTYVPWIDATHGTGSIVSFWIVTVCLHILVCHCVYSFHAHFSLFIHINVIFTGFSRWSVVSPAMFRLWM